MFTLKVNISKSKTLIFQLINLDMIHPTLKYLSVW